MKTNPTESTCSSYLTLHQLPSKCFLVNLNRHSAFIKLNILSLLLAQEGAKAASLEKASFLCPSREFLTTFGLTHSSGTSRWRHLYCRVWVPRQGEGGGGALDPDSAEQVPPPCLRMSECPPAWALAPVLPWGSSLAPGCNAHKHSLARGQRP